LDLKLSEPELLLSVMERCPGWCVIIALVGGGQEIYDGEAGLRAWGEAIISSSRRWTAWVAPEALNGGPSVAGQTLFAPDSFADLDVRTFTELHLTTSKRSPRAERYAEWVNHVINGDSTAAIAALPDREQFPIFLTRNL